MQIRAHSEWRVQIYTGLSKIIPEPNPYYSLMARQEGLEPPTPGLEGPCSIQLSYCRAVFDAPEYIRAAHFTLLRKKVGAPGS